MKQTLLVLISILSVLSACNNDSENLPLTVDGDYIGTFERNGTTSNVELNITNGTYSGESDTDRFPALCNGNYTTSGNSIMFENDCIWTADFDWTLILEGNWDYTLNNNTLTMTKSNGDQYILTKQ